MPDQLPPRWRHRHNFYWYRVPPGLEPLWDNCQEYKLGRTLEEARAEWHRKLAETQPAATETVGDLFDRMLATELVKLDPQLAKTYIDAFRRLRPVFQNVALEAIIPAHRTRYLDIFHRRSWERAGYTSLTRAQNDIGVMTNALSQAVLWGLLDNNPFLEPVTHPTGNARKYLAPWELGEIMRLGTDETKMDPRRRRTLQLGKCYIAIKLLTGASRRGILQIRLSHISPKGLRVDDEIIPWDPDGILRAATRSLRNMAPTVREPYLIVTRDGRPYHDPRTDSHAGFSSVWRRFVADAVKHTNISEPFQEMHLVAAADDLAAITAVLRAESSPQDG